MLRFTYAFHAREVRFERDTGGGFEPAFPETFSFHADRHDPAELYLQLEDLWSNPRRMAPGASRRDAERVLTRLASALPRYLESILDRLEAEGRLEGAALARVHADMALLVLIMSHFMVDKRLDQRAELRAAAFHLRKLAARTLFALMRSRVSSGYLARYITGVGEPFEPNEEVSETRLFYALSGEDGDEVDRWIVGMAERAFFAWLEDVCLDESNRAFEREQSPFASREREVLAACAAGHVTRLRYGRQLTPFLRRRRSRNVRRVLGKLEAWFLRQYDVHHAAVMIQHAAYAKRDRDDADFVLSHHRGRNYAVLLALLALPFIGAALAYDRAPRLFDLACSLEVAFIFTAVFGFLGLRFFWQRDLTFFHASVPRIGAGIIVGFLPVFLIDEVWDLVAEPWPMLLAVVALLGAATLLYLYVEVQRRLGDTPVAFARARAIFLLGLLEAFALGVMLTSLFGRLMVIRNWADQMPEGAGPVSLQALAAAGDPFVGQLPHILGVPPLLTFPSAILLMTFLSFFIGTFLQLMWEDIPITEPL